VKSLNGVEVFGARHIAGWIAAVAQIDQTQRKPGCVSVAPSSADSLEMKLAKRKVGKMSGPGQSGFPCLSGPG
jgi:hypothetical protein